MPVSIDRLRAGHGAKLISKLRRGTFLISRPFILSIALLLVGLIGYLDYATGYEQSLLLFYLVPVALAIWFGNVWSGLIFSVLSVSASGVSDVASGIPGLRYWNIGMALAAYVIFTLLFSKLHTLLRDLDQRVRERTAALQREGAEAARLARAVGA